MKKATYSAIVGITLALGVASLGQAEEIPKNVLAQMGLGGMQRMTATAGMRVRGEGMASVFGSGASIVVFPSFGAHTSSHSATSNTSSALAVGNSASSAQSSIGLELNIVGLAASLNLLTTASSGGNGYAFAR